VTPEQALESLTDVALFITVYVSLIATIWGIGEPQTRGEAMGRAIGLWTCAVLGVMLTIWLIIGMLIRVGLIATVH